MKTKLKCSLVACTTALAIGLGLTESAFAQDAPAFIPVQGSLTGDDGAPRDGTYALEFRLYAQDAGGTAFYAESQIVMIEEGIFTAYIGDGTPADLGSGSTSPPLDLVIFANRPRGVTFLGITIDEDPEMTPRLQLGSVPFAAFAQTCGDATTIGGKPVAMFATSDASSLTSGTISKERLPGLSASDIRDGTFAVSRIPDLSNLYARKDHTHDASPSGDLASLEAKLATLQSELDELREAAGYITLPDNRRVPYYRKLIRATKNSTRETIAHGIPGNPATTRRFIGCEYMVNHSPNGQTTNVNSQSGASTLSFCDLDDTNLTTEWASATSREYQVSLIYTKVPLN
ncbi:MAG: hypothetical protein OXR73_20585 [Myxococcales bacterium]|nr:hypothetical protein [Myxococcales bacterium]